MAHGNGKTAPPAFVEVSLATIAATRTLSGAVASGAWDSVRTELERLDAEDLAGAIGMLGAVDGVERMLKAAVERDPSSPLARTALACRYVHIGWEARGHGGSDTVSAEGWRTFRDFLVRAERILVEVCAAHPAFTAAWAERLTTARGLALGASEARRRFERLRAHAPQHFPAQEAMLQMLCAKWYGSDEEAAAFARETAASAPAGSLAGTLVAQYHLEIWIAGGKKHLATDAVRDEVLAAAARSVSHPGFVPGVTAHSAWTTFALALSLGGHHAEARPFLEALGGRFSGFPGRYVHDPGSYFSQALERARAATDKKVAA
jgi:hypothetical protein